MKMFFFLLAKSKLKLKLKLMAACENNTTLVKALKILAQKWNESNCNKMSKCVEKW